MSDVDAPPTQAAGLTQMQRITNTFAAPSKTFEDIKRGNHSWWLPLIVMALFGYLLFAVINQKVGMQQVVENQIRLSPKAQERMADLSPEQRDNAMKMQTSITNVIFFVTPVIGLIGALVISAVLLGTINFGFGGRAKYSEVLAVSYYAWLPSIIKVLLGIVVLYAGMAPESFNVKNFAPTNVGAFLDPGSTNKALYALATSVDAITIWIAILMGMGIATVAGVKRSSGYITVFGWWLITVLFGAGMAVAFS